MECTKDINSPVRSVAHKLSDFGLVSKLSSADMVAIGAKYHAVPSRSVQSCTGT